MQRFFFRIARLMVSRVFLVLELRTFVNRDLRVVAFFVFEMINHFRKIVQQLFLVFSAMI